MKTNIICILGGFLAGFFLCYRSCKSDVCPKAKTSIIKSFDSGPQKLKQIGVPVVSYIDTGSYHNFGIPVLQKVDTDAIIRQYLQAYTDERHYRSDSADILVQSVVAHDSIINQEATLKWLRPTTIITNTPPVVDGNHRKVYIGAMVSANKNKFLSFTPAIQYENLKGIEFMGGWDILHSAPTVGIFYKIQLHK